MPNIRLFVLFVAVLFPIAAVAGENTVDQSGKWQLRAREHVEWLRVDHGMGEGVARYWGFTNTLNAWYERPFDWAAGLAVGPMLGSGRALSPVPADTDERIRLWSFGGEAKKWLWPDSPSLYLRAGAFFHLFDACGDSYFQPCEDARMWRGGGVLVGIGTEILLWKLGIAPELSLRRAWFDNSRALTGLTPALGLHFYVFARE